MRSGLAVKRWTLRRGACAGWVPRFAFLVPATLFGCDSKGLCPYPSATPVTVTPDTPCVVGRVETCIDPTLVVENRCDGALYLPSDFGQFGPDGSATKEIEVLKGQVAHFVVKPEKALASSDARRDFAIPARVAAKAIQIRFSTLSE